MAKLMRRTFNAQVSERVLKTVHDRELHTSDRLGVTMHPAQPDVAFLTK